MREEAMRLLTAIGAAALLACATAAPSRADSVTSDNAADASLPRAAPAACDEPGPRYRGTLHRTHRVRVHAGYARRRLPGPPVAAFDADAYYNPLLPGTFDTAYDRAMVLHFRSPPVTDTYLAEPGFSPTPPVHGLFPYRMQAWGTVYDYDALIGQYVRLAPPDAARVAAAVPLRP
jgi:hypothetical protein